MDLFDSKPPACEYCLLAEKLDSRDLLCPKFGVVAPDHKCRRFKYDPLKRVPPKPVILKTNYNADDFKID